jgi:hypothetical protein
MRPGQQILMWRGDVAAPENRQAVCGMLKRHLNCTILVNNAVYTVRGTDQEVIGTRGLKLCTSICLGRIVCRAVITITRPGLWQNH